jgi:Lon protease-like protein
MSTLSTTLIDLPLFPLHTVLFPGGWLPLKVFEARYLDMCRVPARRRAVRRVPAQERPRSGAGRRRVGSRPSAAWRASPNATPASSACSTCRRSARSAELLSYRVEGNGLLVGIAQALPDDIPLEGEQALAQFGSCAEVLERIIDALKKSEPDNKLPFCEPFRLDDPSWVSNRLAELLPLDLRARQKLMEFPDVGARIDAVHHVLDRHGWL